MKRNKGLILIIVLWIMMILSLMTVTFVFGMRVEFNISSSYGYRLKALEIAKSGVDYGIAILKADTTSWDGPNDDWRNKPETFKDVPLGQGNFTLFYADIDNNIMGYGLSDEAGKINLNTATKEMLTKLPQVTDEIAEAIIDWRDNDKNPQPQGAEDEYYGALTPPYLTKNQPFETIEELLYVKGISPEVLYGKTTNQNGYWEPNENTDTNGELALGLIHFVTVWSYDLNQTEKGETRLNLNTASDDKIKSTLLPHLTPGQINEIINYKKFGGVFTSVADLLFLPSMDKESFKSIADLVTFIDSPQLPGLININTAPQIVLETLPGIDTETANAIIETRAREDANLANIGWLLDVMDKNKFRGIANLITVRSYQFTINSVGRLDNRNIFKRIKVIIDRGSAEPKTLYWKDVSKLGFPDIEL